LLTERDVTGLGTECIDVELGWQSKHQVKHLLAARNRVSLVQLANLSKLPPTGVELTVAPLKLVGGAGGPARVFAVTGSGSHQGGQEKIHRRHRRCIQIGQINLQYITALISTSGGTRLPLG
jgi:hypothetical protein